MNIQTNQRNWTTILIQNEIYEHMAKQKQPIGKPIELAGNHIEVSGNTCCRWMTFWRTSASMTTRTKTNGPCFQQNHPLDKLETHELNLE